MNYIVFDLEWNQPAWGVPEVTEPLHLTGEIIEIGAVKLNDAFQTVDELCLYIIPQYYTSMNQHVVALTKLHGNFLQENGLPFPQAYAKFTNWCSDGGQQDYAYMTWSQSDLPMLVENMLLHGISVEHLPVCIDVQRMFGREIMRTDRQFALDDAIKILGEQGDRAHDALHDARNTVKVCDHLELDAFIEEYATQPFAEQPLPQLYETAAQVLSDEHLQHFPCPWCGATAQCEAWLPLRGGQVMTMAACPEGDEFLVYLNRNKVDTGGVRVSRMFYAMSDDLWDFYQDQLERKQ